MMKAPLNQGLDPDDDSSSSSAASVHSDSAGSVHGSEHDSVDSVTIHDEIMGDDATTLADWAWANAPRWLTPQKRQQCVDLFLEAAEIYQEWEAQAGEMDLYVIDETNEGDGEEAAA